MTRAEKLEKIMEIISSEAFTFGYDQKQAEYVLNELEKSGMLKTEVADSIVDDIEEIEESVVELKEEE